MKILGIETSCDETSAAVLEINRGNFNLLSNTVTSSEAVQAKYGGIVPEIAARMQIESILPVIETSLKESNTKLKDIDAIAVTYGPGLVTSLTVGVETAKTLAKTLSKKLIPVNHLAGHLLVNHVTNKKIEYPALGLIVSGGHTFLVYIKNESNYKIIGETQDDAVGEAFDKVAKILGLCYPGGPIISKRANEGTLGKHNLPRPMISQENLDFSFSGLKTAVLYLTKKMSTEKIKTETNNICAEFQQACVDVLVSKTLRAIKQHKVKSFLLGGGVAANPELRKALQAKIEKNYPEIKIFIPELKFTGDNAAMIAVAGYFKLKNRNFLKKKKIDSLTANPNLRL